MTADALPQPSSFLLPPFRILLIPSRVQLLELVLYRLAGFDFGGSDSDGLARDSELHIGRFDPPCDFNVAVSGQMVGLLHSSIGRGHEQLGQRGDCCFSYVSICSSL